jgi:hypothetical protein
MSASMFFKGFKEGMHIFGQNIAILVNTILLLIVYLIGVGMTSLVAKISGKRFLDMRTDKNSSSYWKPLNLKKKKMEEYYRQF